MYVKVLYVCAVMQLGIFFVHIEEENQAKRTTMTRRLSVADDKDRVALICKNVPPRFNNSQKLRQHFSKFGEVARVFPKPERGMATIHFKTHVSHYSYMYLINCDLLIKNEPESFNGFTRSIDGSNIDLKICSLS